MTRHTRWIVGASIVLAVALGAGPAGSISAGERVPVPEPTDQAIRYHWTGLGLWFVGRAVALGVPALILFSGWSKRIGNLADGRSGRRPILVVVAIYAAIYLCIEFALKLPLRYYAGYVRAHHYGLSNQSIGRWLGDALKGLGVEVVLAGLFAWVPFWLMRRSPRRWWLYTGLLVLPFSVLAATAAPVVVDPLFNEFGPLKDKALEAKIAALANRAGIVGGQIFEVDKSRDTTTVNAYVTGLMGTKRIVLWDTILQKLDDDEILAVMGHEMGHYVLNHVAIGVTLSAASTLGALWLVGRLANAAIRRFRGRFGFDSIADVASLPLIYLLFEVLMLAAAPATNATSRWMEHEADRFALEATQNNHAAASGFAKLQRDNLAIPYPDPFSRLWRSSHPPIGERIEFCNDYHPWLDGTPLRYGSKLRVP